MRPSAESWCVGLSKPQCYNVVCLATSVVIGEGRGGYGSGGGMQQTTWLLLIDAFLLLSRRNTVKGCGFVSE